MDSKRPDTPECQAFAYTGQALVRAPAIMVMTTVLPPVFVRRC